jgi:hypothetical protein
MTDEEILATADACGMMLFGLGLDKAKFEFCILAFAKFVGEIERFKEREACAKLADEYATWGGSNFYYWFKALATAIRARGEA